MLDVIALDFDYQDQPLLKGVNVHVPSGSIVHLRGANGAGKTTLLKLLAGLYLPAQGEIRFAGDNIHNQLTSYQRQICFVGHKPGINPYLTLKENCQFDLHFALSTKNEIELASIFNLDNYLDHPCGLLSAGQKRQVSLLRLWMTNAPIWLLDEPLVALDEAALSILMGHIELHRKAGGIIILTSHQHLPWAPAEYQEYSL